jgi:hypothetical protein
MNDDYKFLYKIVCEPKLQSESKFIDGQFTTKVFNNLSTVRLRAIDDSIICRLRELGREKNIDLLVAIDESKVLKMVKSLKALEIIKEKKVNIFTFYKCCSWHNASNYNDSVGCPVNCELTQEEYDLLKEVLL